jgi:hypothetical protein
MGCGASKKSFKCFVQSLLSSGHDAAYETYAPNPFLAMRVTLAAAHGAPYKTAFMFFSLPCVYPLTPARSPSWRKLNQFAWEKIIVTIYGSLAFSPKPPHTQ